MRQKYKTAVMYVNELNAVHNHWVAAGTEAASSTYGVGTVGKVRFILKELETARMMGRRRRGWGEI